MATMMVKETIETNVPAATVVEFLLDFRNWPTWSPWLVCEPSAEVSFSNKQSEVGASFAWKGDLTGEGKMSVRSISDRLLQYDIHFLKPYKQTAKAWIDVKPLGNSHCRVSWGLDSKLPLFMLLMTKKLTGLVSLDYQRGLRMLKDCLEQGAVNSKIEIQGIEHFASEQNYVGIKRTCKIGSLSQEIEPAVGKLLSEAESLSIDIPDSFHVLYESLDPISQEITWVAALPVNEPLQGKHELSNYLLPAQLSGINVEHVGECKHLRNGWAAAVLWVQNAKGKKPHKSIMGREVYLNRIGEVPNSELKTKITMFVRS